MSRSLHSKLYASSSRILGFALGCALAFGCSVDKEEHPDWVGDEAVCKSRPGAWKPYRGFCYRVDAGAGDDEDAGAIHDASVADGGDGSIIDASSDAGDGGPIESCPMPGLEATCYEGPPGTGQQQPCHPGLRTCTEFGWGSCRNQVIPKSVDSCNGIDDDCDGSTDEGQPQRDCMVEDESVMGACAEGFARCDRGRETCIRYKQPTTETCNGIDDDCDGSTDEGIEIACYPAAVGCTPDGMGGYDCAAGSICTPGKFICVDGSLTTECAGDVMPQSEVGTPVGETAVDEDCDGMTDENIACLDGQMFQCYTGPAGTRNNPPCVGGTRSCVGTMMEMACNGEVVPQPETCANDSNTDDDCDGVADDVASRNTSCAAQSSEIGACKANAVWQCVDGAETCVDAAPSMELCDGNGSDEDCDSRIDEGFDLSVDENNCGACGVRCSAGQTCCGSVCVNLQTSNAHCGSCGNACPSTLTCCAGGCVNTRTSATNCGSCGKSCLLGCANSSCNLL
jgi:hypothetical protein